MRKDNPKTKQRATSPSRIQSLDRAVAILNSFTTDRPELGVTEIARLTGLTRSTAHRILTNLEMHQLVRQVRAGGRYALGPGLLRLAHSARGNLEEFARPVMAWLRDETDETVGLHIVNGERFRMVVDQVESRQSIRRTYTSIGEPLPIHQGAPGKVLLAYLPDDLRQQILSEPLEAATKSTIVDPDLLRKELESVRERGFATSFAERVDGVFTVAVPVFDYRGSATAALSVTGPAGRLSEERLLEFAPHAQMAAKNLSSMLGFAKESDDSSPNPLSH